MNALEAEQFIDNELIPRWPDYRFSPAELADWKFYLTPFTYDSAITAIRGHAAKQEYTRKPVLSAFRQIARTFSGERLSAGPPDATLFVACTGGGRLGAGFFFPVHTRPGVNESTAAKVTRGRNAELYGGEWVVYESTHAAMTNWRRELQLAAAAGKESA